MRRTILFVGRNPRMRLLLIVLMASAGTYMVDRVLNIWATGAAAVSAQPTSDCGCEGNSAGDNHVRP